MNAVGRNQFCRTETARMIPLTFNVTFTFIECVPWILCSVKRPFKYCMATLCFEPCPVFCHVIANYYRHSFFFSSQAAGFLSSVEFHPVVAAIQMELLKDTITFSHLLITVRLGLCVATTYLWLTQIDPPPQCSSFLSLYRQAASLD